MLPFPKVLPTSSAGGSGSPERPGLYLQPQAHQSNSPHASPYCSTSSYSPEPNPAAAHPGPVWGPIPGTEEAHPSFRGAHTISFLASSHTHSVERRATAGIQLGSGPRPGPAAAASVSRLRPGPSFGLTPSPPLPSLPSLLPVLHTQPSSVSAVSSCQPALSFTQSPLFRGGHPQHSALHPQRSCWPLTQCLGVFAAAAVAGSPGQLNKAAWHQLSGAA